MGRENGELENLNAFAKSWMTAMSLFTDNRTIFALSIVYCFGRSSIFELLDPVRERLINRFQCKIWGRCLTLRLREWMMPKEAGYNLP